MASTVKLPVAWFSKVPPPPLLMLPSDHVAEPALLRMRPALSDLVVPDIWIPPSAWVIPAPVIVPPVQVSGPLAVSVPLPPKMPPEIVNRLVLPAELKLAVPLLMAVVPVRL